MSSSANSVVDSASALYRAIAARARPAGGESEREARRLCQAYLEARGFTCREQEFEYSSFPARFTVPLVGVVLLGCALAIGVANAVERGAGATNLVVLTIWCLTLGTAAWLGRYGTAAVPWFRRKSVNLEATRWGRRDPLAQGAAVPAFDVSRPAVPGRSESDAGFPGDSVKNSDRFEPALWLMAHLDSKSQPIPMALRVAAVLASLIGWGGILSLSFVALVLGGTLSIFSPVIVAFAILAALGATGLICCVIGNKSAGALDNASGVATVLASIDHIDPQIPFRVILTSAEELGLAGAYAYLGEWKRRQQFASHGTPAAQTPIVINCDSFDDRGAVTCMFPKRDAPLFNPSCADASRQTATEINTRRLVPGILTDSVAFSAAGFRAMTISRGTWSTLARIHSHRDTISFTSGAEIDHISMCVATIVMNVAQRALFHPSLID